MGISGGPALKYFYIIHRGGRLLVLSCVDAAQESCGVGGPHRTHGALGATSCCRAQVAWLFRSHVPQGPFGAVHRCHNDCNQLRAVRHRLPHGSLWATAREPGDHTDGVSAGACEKCMRTQRPLTHQCTAM